MVGWTEWENVSSVAHLHAAPGELGLARGAAEEVDRRLGGRQLAPVRRQVVVAVAVVGRDVVVVQGDMLGAHHVAQAQVAHQHTAGAAAGWAGAS